MNNDIRYIEIIKACGLEGDHLGDLLELCYQVAKDEREECAKLADGWSKRNDDVGAFIGQAIRAGGEK